MRNVSLVPCEDRERLWDGVPAAVGWRGCAGADTLASPHGRRTSVSRVDSATPWTVAGQAPLSMGFPSQEYWSDLPFPPPRDLPNPGIKLTSPALAGRFFTAEPPGKS